MAATRTFTAVANCVGQTQTVDVEITYWTLQREVVDFLELAFGPIVRLQGRGVNQAWMDINDKDAWFIFTTQWNLASSEEQPTMFIQATSSAPNGHQIPRPGPGPMAGFNADMGRRHTNGPYPWAQHELIGRGAKSLVVKGQLDSGAWIAVKAFDVSTQRNAAACAAELSILGRVQHLHIVPLLDTYPDPNRPMVYLLLEYQGKGSLRQLLYTEGTVPLPAHTMQDYTRQILEGLAYLHSQHIVHRDVKAANILISDEDVLKLADFDISQDVPTNGIVDQPIQWLIIEGSPYWFSPEMCLGLTYDLKTDIWSFGCVLIEMLTGGLPWPILSSSPSIIAIIGESQGPPTNLPKDLPPVLDDFAHSCFQRDPHNRPSADVLLQHPYLQ